MRFKTSQLYYPFILFILIIFLNSCNKDIIETNNWSPELLVPLTNVKLTLADLIPEKGSVVYDDDNFIRLAYRDDNVFSFSTDSLIDFSNHFVYLLFVEQKFSHISWVMIIIT